MPGYKWDLAWKRVIKEGLASNESEARRLIEEGRFHHNGFVATKPDTIVCRRTVVTKGN